MNVKEIEKIAISAIELDEEIQSRVELNQDCVDEYTDDLRDGAIFPPIQLFYDGEKYWCADGAHRTEAFKKVGINTIEAIVHEGSRHDALIYSAGANADHGLRRTNADKRKSVKKVFMLEKYKAASAGKIAKICKVTQPFVSKMKKKLTQNGYEFPTQCVGLDGKLRETQNIGKGNSSSITKDSDDEIEGTTYESDEDSQGVTATIDESDDEDSRVAGQDTEELTPEAENVDSISEAETQTLSEDDESSGVDGEGAEEPISEVEDGEASDDNQPTDISVDSTDQSGADEEISDDASEHEPLSDEETSDATEDVGTSTEGRQDSSPATAVTSDDERAEMDEVENVQSPQAQTEELEKQLALRDDRIMELENILALKDARIMELEGENELLKQELENDENDPSMFQGFGDVESTCSDMLGM